MSLTNLIWPPTSAVAFVLLFDQICVRIREVARARRYAVQRRRRQEILAGLRKDYGFPAYVGDKRADGLLALVAGAHAKSIAAQDTYQREIVRSAAALAVAFSALTISVTVIHELPSIKILLAWIDLAALIAVLYHFVLARRALPLWIDGRACTELLRQYAFLSVLFPSLLQSRTNLDLTSSFEAERIQIEREVIQSKRDILPDRIIEFWNTRRQAINAAEVERRDIASNVLRLYLDRRCLGQVGWFGASRERVHRSDDNRGLLLAILYGLSIVLACAKVILLQIWIPDDAILVEVLACALLLITGGTAAVSALYFGQNIRSLVQRYRVQERDLRKWVTDFNLAHRTHLIEERSEVGSHVELRDAILRFEDLMVKELTDWIDISEHDSIELGP